jgi:hypothetical protein
MATKTSLSRADEAAAVDRALTRFSPESRKAISLCA